MQAKAGSDPNFDMDQARISAALASAPGALVKLGCAMIDSGEGVKAISLFKSLLRQNPDDPALKSAARKVFSYAVPRWHQPMLRDQLRNDLYQRAIERAVRPGMRVLDIGTGSGLLAMMAARAGASVVVACEVNPIVAATAAEIVAANGYSGQVRVIPRKSTELDREADLGGGADLIVSEIFSDDLLIEGALPSFDHARRELASPGAQYIPRAASMRVALGYHDKADFEPLERLNGFDLSLFDRHVAKEHRIPVGSRHLQLCSTAVDLLAFDLQAGESPRGGTASATLTAEHGTANGVAQWIRLELDEETIYENRPSPDATSAWDFYFRSLPGNSVVEVGEQCTIHVAHDGERVHFW
jgi:type II protein arginine methyltransferase